MRRPCGSMVMFSMAAAGGLWAQSAQAQPRVAIVSAASTSPTATAFTDPQAKLLATGMFTSVDIFSVATPAPLPTLNDLMAYDAVIVWSNQDFTDEAILGDLLADYTDVGKGVVGTVYAVNTTTVDRFLTGRWAAGDYAIIQPQTGTETSTAMLGTIHVPGHAIMQGVNTLDSNFSGRPESTELTANGVRIADWSDGRPLAAVSSVHPRRVDLGLYPPSSAVSATFWDETTDGARLMANSLVYASQGADGSFPPVASGAASVSPITAGNSVLITVNALPGVNPPSTGITVTADLSAFGGSAAQPLADQGGNVFTHMLNIPANQPGGQYAIRLTVSDAEMRQGPGTVYLRVLTNPGPGYTPEVEPNNSKDTATPVMLASGQGVVGETTGTSTSATGSTTADYYLITTTPAAPGIYRHQLTLTSAGTLAHTGTLRGLTQTSGVINIGSDTGFQTAAAIDGRAVQWYGFGQGESVYYRVTGTEATTESYTATLQTSTVTPIDLGTTLPPGSITITRGSGNTTGLDMLIYDANFQAVGDFLNKGSNTLTRTFNAGTYYLAVSNVSTSDHRASPPDSAAQTRTVMDFPGVVANNSTALVGNMSIAFGAGPTFAEVFASKDNIFDVAFIRFVVGIPCPGDFNGVGGITVQDIFDFLTAYFAGDPRADVNGVGGLTVQDIFDFLTSYFAGC